MRVGFFSMFMDKIQHDYHWDDETILNMTLARAVQVKEAIEQREEFARWEQNKVLEWQTRHLVATIANCTIEDRKSREEMISYANSLSIYRTDDTKKKTRSAAPPKSSSTGKPMKMFKTLDGKEVPATELHNYSYDEIDHTEEERESYEKARKRNAGMNIIDIFSSGPHE